MSRRNARIGMMLFCVYLTFYGGFVLLNAFLSEVVERTAWAPTITFPQCPFWGFAA